MKNTMLNRSTLNFTVVTLLTLLFAGCAVAPKAENLSVATTAAHMQTSSPAIVEPADLQSSPSDSPGFTPWGPLKNIWQ